MLSARRKSDGQTVSAYFQSKLTGPFSCLECNEEVVLKTGRFRTNHFAHTNPIACRFAEGESEAHRRCKIEIYLALQKQPSVRNVALERSFDNVRPDLSAYINGTLVAIEVQISSLSLDTILRRTIEYARKDMYVLWLLPWTPELDSRRYAPQVWEKWIHAAYFGQIYYWLEGLSVARYHFEKSFRTVPRIKWYSNGGKEMIGGGYSKESRRYRTPVRDKLLNLATDFGPKRRYWWEGGGLKVPDATLFMHKD